MIGHLEELIKAEDFDSAVLVIPTLESLFLEQNEIIITLEHLKGMLNDHNPQCQQKLDDLKHLLVG